MLKIKVNGKSEFDSENKNGAMLLNNLEVASDWNKTGDNKYHVIHNNGSYQVELLSADESGKELVILINGVKHQVSVSNQYDELLKKLGMDKIAGNKVNDVKAPMPGMVLRMMVKEGDAIKKGDPLLVLEAMKMENVIKAAGDGVVKKINVNEKVAVEKNQVLITLE